MTGLSIQMVFSPQRCTLERLDETLTSSRRELAERLLRRYTGIVQQGGSHHTMLVGPRGSGKSHVLTYVAKKLVESTEKSGVHPNIIMLPEEERSIARPFDFILALLRAVKVPEDAIRARVRGTDPEALMAEATSMLDETIAGRPTLILAENLNEIFGALGSDTLPRLRAFFQEHANISMLGTTTVLWNESDRPDHPFYGFFEIVSLRELTRQEAHRYLRALAKADGDDALYRALATPMGKARVKAIYHLTGGNPRLLTMLSAFLTADGLDTLVGPFVQMADRELTPYYQQRLDRLSPTQGKVVMLLADTPQPQTVTEIMERGYLDQRVTSRALNDLLQCALVNRHPRGRESYYELREPLLRLVLDLKVSGEKPLGLIVDMLRLWYDAEELRALECDAPDRAKVYLRAALEGTIERADAIGSIKIPGVRVSGSGEVTSGQSPEQMAAAISHAVGTLKEGRVEEALSSLESISTACRENGADLHEGALALVLVYKGDALAKLGRYEDALATFSDVERRFGASDLPEVREMVAMALVNRGVTLDHLGRPEEALVTFSEVEARLANCNLKELQAILAWNVMNKGATLQEMGRADESLEAYDEVQRRLLMSDSPDVLEIAAWSLTNKGQALADLGRAEDALAAFAEVESRFGACERPELQKQVARALSLKAGVLTRANEFEDALAVTLEVERRFGTSEQADLQEEVARALSNRAAMLIILNRPDAALSAISDVERRYGESKRPELQRQAALALICKGMALGQSGRLEEAKKTYEQIVAQFGPNETKAFRRICAMALAKRAQIALDMGEYFEAIEYSDRAIGFSPDYAWALGFYAEAQFGLGRAYDAIGAIERFVVYSKPEDDVRPPMAARLIKLLRCRSADLKEVLRCFGNDHESLASGLMEWISSCLPMTEESARDLIEAESNLAAAFSGIEGAQLPLKMLNAARRDALGDAKALLELPLELRRLIKPEPGDKHDDSEGE